MRLLAVLLVMAGNLHAQAVLKITELFPNWPSVSLKFTYRCDGEWRFNIPSSNIKIFENGVEVKDYTTWCPDTGTLCPLAAVMVLDGSESMAGFKNEQTKKAAKHLVGLMDGLKDEAALIWFNRVVTLAVPMTRYQDRILAEIDNLPATDVTAAWDATYTAINHIANFSNVPKPCRAVILLTDGKDNSSGKSLEQVIAYALSEQVRVFVVAIGPDVNDTGLLALAMRTNGKYFHSVDAIGLDDIFERVFIEARSLNECQLFYRSSCPDGTERIVELRVSDYCGTTVSATRLYAAPLDSSMFAIGYFEAGSVTTKEQTVAEIPIHAISLPWSGEFPPGSMTLEYDTSCISFVEVQDGGTLLENGNVRASRVPKGVKLEWDAADVQQNFGILFLTYFRTFKTDTSSCCEIKISDFKFKRGCLKPVAANGALCYYSIPPDVACSIIAPDSLQWSYAQDDYIPNPFRVTYVLHNYGTKIARNVRYTINYNSRQLTLVQPASATQTGKARDLGAGETDTVSWLVRMNPQGKTGALSLCITAHFDNREDLECCSSIRVEQAPSTMLCSIDVPKIIAQTTLERYSPMPFQAIVTVLNSGVETKDSVWAEIYLRDGLTLFGGDAARKFITKKLFPDSTASGSWTLYHRPVLDSLFIPVSVVVISTSGDTTHCQTIVIIPPLDASDLEATCSVPSFLDLDPFTLQYNPNPFSASVSIKNYGTRAAANVNAFLLLPNALELEPQETLRKTAVPSTIGPGEEVRIEWALRYKKKQVNDQRLYYTWSVGGTTEGGVPIDSVTAKCNTAVPGVPASLVCSIEAIDTLFVDPDIGLIYPNPIPVQVKVRNTTVLTRGLTRVRASISSGDASFEIGTPALRELNTLMNPGRVINLLWYIRIKPSKVQQYISIVVSVVDAEGLETQCTHAFIVPPSPLYVSCSIDASSRVLAYLRSTGGYFPDSISVTAVLRNESGNRLTDVPIRLDMDGQDTYLGVKSGIPGNTLDRLVPQWGKDSSISVTWILEPKLKNETGNPETVILAVSYFDAGRGWLRTGCNVDIVLEPQNLVETELHCRLTVPDTIRYVDTGYVPEVFTANVQVTNEGAEDAVNVQIFLLQDTRFSAVGPPIRIVQTIPAGVTHTISPDFELQVTPSQIEGYDTLRVLVIADEDLSTSCEMPVFIERVLSPELFVECVADIDSIRYSEAVNSYVPGEFLLSSLIANTGDGIARAVAATAILPPGYQLLDSATVSVGILPPGGSANLAWRIKPACESNASLDSLRVIIRGNGGLHNQLHIDECVSAVYKDPCNGPHFETSCDLPDTITFVDDAGGYFPAPVTFSFVVKNASSSGQAPSTARISEFIGFSLAPGEAAVKNIPALSAGADYSVQWEVVPSVTQDSITGRICAEVTYKNQAYGKCCREAVIIPFNDAQLRVLCSAPDSVYLDPSGRAYANVPLTFCADITNTGTTGIDSVELLIELSGGLELSGSPNRLLTGPFGPGAMLPQQCWAVRVPASGNARQAWIKITATVGGKKTQCVHSIHIPAIPAAAYTCAVSTGTGDTLASERRTVSIRVKLAVTKSDSASWDDLDALLSVTPPLVLAPGESPSKVVAGGVVSGNTAELEWRIELPPLYRDAAASVNVSLLIDEHQVNRCERQLAIDGIAPRAGLHIPDDIFASFGRRFSIPVYVDSIDPVGITDFRFGIQFDPTLFHVTGYSATGTATEVGWNITSFTNDNASGKATLSAKAAGSAGQLNGGNLLFYLVGTPVGDERREELAFFESPIAFSTATAPAPANDNAMVTSVDGVVQDLELTTTDGRVYVTGDCILPVNASGSGFSLTGSPNPFNPETRLKFTVPADMQVKITVYDLYGRKVAVLFDGWAPAGFGSVTFQAAEVPAGMYVAIMETPYGFVTENLILAK